MFDRISVDPSVCHGQPCIKGTRIMVYLILELVEAGIPSDKIISDYYPGLTEEDIKASVRYAVELLKNQEFVPFAEASQ